MPLPKLNTPVYTLTIPSAKEVKKFRPFLVKEEKNLLLALQENEGKNIPTETIKMLINSCFFGELDFSSLTSYDIEYIMLQLRAKSRGSLVQLSYRCNNEIIDGDNKKICNTPNSIEIDIEKVQFSEGKESKVMLEDSIGVLLKHPTFNELRQFNSELDKEKDKKNVTIIYEIIAKCIDKVFDGENVYTQDDYTQEELNDWISGLSSAQFSQIKDFFDNQPTVYIDTEIECKACKHKETIRIQGLTSFLD